MRRPGFTLVEVVIVTLFFSLLFWGGRAGYRWYVRSSHADDAKAFLEELAAAQARSLDEHGRYLSHGNGLSDAFPSAIPEDGATLLLPEELKELGLDQAPRSPFFFRVAVLAGANNPPPPEVLRDSSLRSSSLLLVPGQPWFYLVAFADQDGDGELAKLELASWDNEGVIETNRTE